MEPVLWIIMLFFIFPAIFKAIIKMVDSNNAKRPIIKVAGNR